MSHPHHPSIIWIQIGSRAVGPGTPIQCSSTITGLHRMSWFLELDGLPKRPTERCIKGLSPSSRWPQNATATMAKCTKPRKQQRKQKACSYRRSCVGVGRTPSDSRGSSKDPHQVPHQNPLSWRNRLRSARTSAGER